MKIHHTLLLLILMNSCTPWKDLMVKKGDANDAIRNAIMDVSHSNKKSHNDSVYFVNTEDISKSMIGINIYATNNKICLITEDSLSYSYRAFPTDYSIINQDLYYWYDSTKTVTDKLISILNGYNLIDTLILNVYMPAMEISHNKATDYYFCKTDLTNYKKVWTKSAMGYYDPPKLNCIK